MWVSEPQQVIKRRKGIWNQVLKMLSQKATFMPLHQTPRGPKECPGEATAEQVPEGMAGLDPGPLHCLTLRTVNRQVYEDAGMLGGRGTSCDLSELSLMKRYETWQYVTLECYKFQISTHSMCSRICLLYNFMKSNRRVLYFGQNTQ